MSDDFSHRKVNERERRSVFHLVFCGVLLCLIYAAITWLSRSFTYQTLGVARPIIEVLCLLAIAFVIYLLSIRVAIRAGEHRLLILVIGLFSLSLRLVLLFSEPIQEVDIYRYLWDGQATIHGVSPFQFSPKQVLDTSADHTQPPDLSRLVAVKDSSPTIQEILKRVHYSELTTVYPPVSQSVFALAAFTTSSHAGLSTYLIIMKGWIIAFDMVTIWLLIQILRITARPIGWSVVYAWCPLVLKEFANSGHLDSIAVCLSTLAVYLMLRAFYNSVDRKTIDRKSNQNALIWGLAASVVLGLAVGAKLYPVVLAPLLISVSLQKWGWARASLVAFVFILVSAGICWPMVQQNGHDSVVGGDNERHSMNSKPSLPSHPHHAPAPDEVDRDQREHGDGLTTFLSRWKINDFLFMLLSENLTPTKGVPRSQRPWFLITTETWRLAFVEQFAGPLSIQRTQVPFVLARTMTACVFVFLACYFCWRAVRMNEATRFLEAVFLTLAWFWLLLPTQNPWYWTWALPFLPFVRNRAWLAVSGLALLYYLRFWLGYHWPNSPLLFTVYSGKPFFDFVVTWVEFGPWFIWLAVSGFMIRRNLKRNALNLTL